ncbi:unnamed protein product [Arabidopsis thaliana]|uniref:RING-type E3 ubiquitin transferase n=1 Tax=Arabidopsis thaliana TaxID=3702 RepID=A0A5S9YAB3_ARATH|nr:unnamed protein product [Arabidopsis thaliana]
MIESMPSLDVSSIVVTGAILIVLFTLYIISDSCNKYIQPPTELALETHQNSHPSLPPLPVPLPLPLPQPQPQPQPQQDNETGHLMPLQSQLEFKIGYRASIEEMEFKDIEKEGFDEIGCSICLEELEDGHEIIRIKKCRHVFHRSCIDSWLKQNRSCPNCRCF